MAHNKEHELDRLQKYHKTVRGFGIRKAKFLEFDYTLGCEELTIELVMPYPAFKEFCETNHVAEIICVPQIRYEYNRLAGAEKSKLHEKTNIIQLGDFK